MYDDTDNARSNSTNLDGGIVGGGVEVNEESVEHEEDDGQILCRGLGRSSILQLKRALCDVQRDVYPINLRCWPITVSIDHTTPVGEHMPDLMSWTP